MSSSNHSVLDVRAKTRQVVDHHYDDEKPGKPLYLMVPGGIIALASLALIFYIAYRIWIQHTLLQASGLTLMALLAPIYIGGVFLFSYGYELYDVPKALRLTAILAFVALAAVVIVAVLLAALGAMGGQGLSSESGSSNSSSSSRRRRGGGGMGFGMWPWPIFLGGWGSPTQTVTREVIHEAPAAPPPPQPIECPYCGNPYVPAQTNFLCPTCGAPTPKDMMPPDASSG